MSTNKHALTHLYTSCLFPSPRMMSFACNPLNTLYPLGVLRKKGGKLNPDIRDGKRISEKKQESHNDVRTEKKRCLWGKNPPKTCLPPFLSQTSCGHRVERTTTVRRGKKEFRKKRLVSCVFLLWMRWTQVSPGTKVTFLKKQELLATLQANDHVVNKFKPQCPVFPPLPSSCIFPHRGHHAHRYRDVRWKILDYALKFKKKNPGKKIAWGATTSVFIISEQRFASSMEQQSKLDKPNVDTQVRRQQTAGKKTR